MSHYYNEDYVSPLVEDWLINRSPEKLDLIMREVMKIAKAIIYKHKFTQFEKDPDELVQVCMESCLKALPKYDPTFVNDKGKQTTTFNYFSLVCKIACMASTSRQKRNRNVFDVDDYQYSLEAPEDKNGFHIEDLCTNLDRIKEEMNIKSKNRNRYTAHRNIKLIDMMKTYIRERGEFDKRDFYSQGRNKGYHQTHLVYFFKTLRKYEYFFYT